MVDLRAAKRVEVAVCAKKNLLGQIAGTPRPDVIVVVCDASNLERNLFLVTQVLELGRPVIVEQGFALGRPSRIRVSVAGPRVRVGGSGLVVAEGTLAL